MEKAAKNLVGVYLIKCNPSGDCFIGSSQSMHQAFLKTMSALVSGMHGNPLMQSLWNHFGPASYEFSILEVVKDRYSLVEREKFWLQKKNAKAIFSSDFSSGSGSAACGSISIQKDLRDEIRALRSSTMLDTVHFLLQFYKDHHK